MFSVLLISTYYSLTQKVKAMLQQHGELYRLVGTVDNSVLGLSMIESTSPDFVIMPAYMNFWNAEDLILNLLPRGISPTFILLHDGETLTLSPAVSRQVAAVVPAEPLAEDQLLQALQAPVDTGHSQAGRQPFSGVQHSMEVMELLMGLTPLRLGNAQMEFGRFRVDRKSCWILLGAPESGTGYNFFSQPQELEEIFQQLDVLLTPTGNCELCIYRDTNLCILLEERPQLEPDWSALCRRINQLLGIYDVPRLSFEISNAPVPLEHWHSQCSQLLKLREKRFFSSALWLQPKTVEAYAVPVSQTALREKLSALSTALLNLQRKELSALLDELEQMVSHSLSMDIYSFVLAQLVIQYTRLRYSYGPQAPSDDFSINLHQFKSVSETFAAFRELLLSLLDWLDTLNVSPNRLVLQMCSFISEHLSERLTLDIVARHVHASPTYLCKLFKRETGESFPNYINRNRILRAKRLLEMPYKIIDVASMAGFENSKYFSQVFKRQVGMTPQQYRLSLHKEEAT